MEVVADATFRDRAVFLDGVLVVADLHVGRGVASNVELPVGDGVDMVERLQALCEQFTPDVVVIAGDLLHSFETVPRLVDETVSEFREIARRVDAGIVVTPGNHDTMLDVVWDGQTTPEFRIEGTDTVVCHGHVEPDTEAARYIIGHDHPAISIQGRKRQCALVGEGVYRGADVIVLPTFNRLVSGVEINQLTASDFMSPLVTDLDAFAPLVRDEAANETLSFPPLGEFRHRL